MHSHPIWKFIARTVRIIKGLRTVVATGNRNSIFSNLGGGGASLISAGQTTGSETFNYCCMHV